MFKNAIFFRIGQAWTPDLQALEQGLKTQRFTPCGPTQQTSYGWIEPRGQEHGPMVESIGGHWILKLCIETKKVPASHVQSKLIERLKKIESSTGRKPGRKESKEIKEEILLDLLPHAFPTQGVLTIWIDPDDHMMVIDATAMGKADTAVTALVQILEQFSITKVQTETTPATQMSHWLRTDEAPYNFSVDRECELKAVDESKSVVKYGRHPLDILEVKQHIQQGKVPTKLAMTWADRVSFVLTDALVLKKITFLEGVYEGADKAADSFDTDFAIMTGELKTAFKDLVNAHEGELALET